MGSTCKASSLLKYVVGITLRIGTGHLPLAQVIEFLKFKFLFSLSFEPQLFIMLIKEHCIYQTSKLTNVRLNDSMLLTLKCSFIGITCERLTVPTNGFVAYPTDAIIPPHPYLTRALYGCHTAYGLSGGDYETTCVGSGPGEWNGIAPTCERKNNTVIYQVVSQMRVYYFIAKDDQYTA